MTRHICQTVTSRSPGGHSHQPASQPRPLAIRDEYARYHPILSRDARTPAPWTDPAGTRWPISTHLTDEGVMCVDLYEGQVDLYQAQKADPAPIQRSGPMPSHLVVNVGGVKVGGPSRIPGRYRWQQSR